MGDSRYERYDRYEVDGRGCLVHVVDDGQAVCRRTVAEPSEARGMLDALRAGEGRLPEPLSDEFFVGGVFRIARVTDNPRGIEFVHRGMYGNAPREFIDWLNAHVEAGTFGERES